MSIWDPEINVNQPTINFLGSKKIDFSVQSKLKMYLIIISSIFFFHQQFSWVLLLNTMKLCETCFQQAIKRDWPHWKLLFNPTGAKSRWEKGKTSGICLKIFVLHILINFSQQPTQCSWVKNKTTILGFFNSFQMKKSVKLYSLTKRWLLMLF